MQENERSTRSFLEEHFLPYLWRRLPFLTVDVQTGTYGIEKPSRFPGDHRALLSDLEFENMVEMRLVGITELMKDGERVRLLIDRIVQLIEMEIDEI